MLEKPYDMGTRVGRRGRFSRTKFFRFYLGSQRAMPNLGTISSDPRLRIAFEICMEICMGIPNFLHFHSKIQNFPWNMYIFALKSIVQDVLNNFAEESMALKYLRKKFQLFKLAWFEPMAKNHFC